MTRGGASGAAIPPECTTPVLVAIPFRDRGRDPLRAANLRRVLEHWSPRSMPVAVVSDGRSGDTQFNRSAAYNQGAAIAELLGCDVIVYAEADMLVPVEQIREAVELARAGLGMVVPFTDYHYLSADDSECVRGGLDPGCCTPEWSRYGESVGAITVVSRATLDAVGRWDESFNGSWWDDTAMALAFARATGAPTRVVAGPAWHLYHLPGWTGEHLTEADRDATAANQARYRLYEQAATPDEILALTGP